MKRFMALSVLLCLWLAAAPPLRAQMLENPQAAPESAPAPDFSIPPKPDAPTLLNEPAKQDLTALALQYYGRCMDTVYPDISEAGRSDFCMCGATHARNALSAEELAFAATGKGSENIRYFEADAFFEKMDTTVSFPCLHYVIKDRENSACLENGQIKHFFVTQDAYDNMCLCTAGRMDVFMNEVGPAMLMAARVREINRTPDPAEAITSWPDYKAELGKSVEECLNIYGYK